MYEMFQQLTRRRVAEGAGWRFDLHDGGKKFAELRLVEGGWQVRATCVEVAYCLRARLDRLRGTSEVEALAAIRAGCEDVIRNEDDTAECFDERMHALISEYRKLRQEFEMDVDSDSVSILKPTVDRLRVVERDLNLLPYVIGGSVYNGLGDDFEMEQAA